jgi:hypothetical protein
MAELELAVGVERGRRQASDFAPRLCPMPVEAGDVFAGYGGFIPLPRLLRLGALA